MKRKKIESYDIRLVKALSVRNLYQPFSREDILYKLSLRELIAIREKNKTAEAFRKVLSSQGISMKDIKLGIRNAEEEELFTSELLSSFESESVR